MTATPVVASRSRFGKGFYYWVFVKEDDEFFHGEYLYTYITMCAYNPRVVRMLAFRDLTTERSIQSMLFAQSEKHTKSNSRQNTTIIESRHVPFIPQNQFHTLSFEFAHYINPCVCDIATALQQHDIKKKNQLHTLKTLALFQLSTRELSIAKNIL